MMWNKSNNGTECKLILNMTRFPIEIGKIRQVSVLVSLKMTFEPNITTPTTLNQDFCFVHCILKNLKSHVFGSHYPVWEFAKMHMIFTNDLEKVFFTISHF